VVSQVPEVVEQAVAAGSSRGGSRAVDTVFRGQSPRRTRREE